MKYILDLLSRLPFLFFTHTGGRSEGNGSEAEGIKGKRKINKKRMKERTIFRTCCHYHSLPMKVKLQAFRRGIGRGGTRCLMNEPSPRPRFHKHSLLHSHSSKEWKKRWQRWAQWRKRNRKENIKRRNGRDKGWGPDSSSPLTIVWRSKGDAGLDKRNKRKTYRKRIKKIINET